MLLFFSNCLKEQIGVIFSTQLTGSLFAWIIFEGFCLVAVLFVIIFVLCMSFFRELKVHVFLCIASGLSIAYAAYLLSLLSKTIFLHLAVNIFFSVEYCICLNDIDAPEVWEIVVSIYICSYSLTDFGNWNKCFELLRLIMDLLAYIIAQGLWGMGKRKSRSKPPPKKRMDKLDTVFSCPFCNHGTSIECRMYVYC